MRGEWRSHRELNGGTLLKVPWDLAAFLPNQKTQSAEDTNSVCSLGNHEL